MYSYNDYIKAHLCLNGLINGTKLTNDQLMMVHMMLPEAPVDYLSLLESIGNMAGNFDQEQPDFNQDQQSNVEDPLERLKRRKDLIDKGIVTIGSDTKNDVED